ncbi:oligosaccharide repeat unit polymerase [Thermodesulfovibrionales bacterium]|nr:oligosaccharide repeat unit polymerase [Thermodesulfovibrionales bacterium]
MKMHSKQIRKKDMAIIGVSAFLLLVVSAIIISLIYIEHLLVGDWVVVITFIPIIIMTLLMIIYALRNRPVSLNLMHLLFVLIFFGLAPLVQYLTESFPWGLHPITGIDIIRVNFFIYLWMICYFLVYYSKRTQPGRYKLLNVILQHQISYRNLVLMLILSILTLFYFWEAGTFGAWTRAAFVLPIDAGPLHLIASHFFRAISIVTLAIIALFLIKNRKQANFFLKGVFISLIVFIVLLNNPLAAPRFFTAAVVIGFITIVWLRKQKTGAFITIAVVAGIFVMFPLINFGRYLVELEEILPAVRALQPVEVLRFGDFDAYAMFVHTSHYIRAEGITYGRQLLGSLLFFIPRAFWDTKPVGSGHHVATYFQAVHTNVSSPLPAEGMINFGILGIIMFAIIFARICRILDDYYVNANASKDNSVRLIEVLYPFWLGFIFLMSRGDLMSSLAFVTGFSLAGVLLVLPRVVFKKKQVNLEQSLSRKRVFG